MANIYAETREVKAIQKFLSILGKITPEQVKARDPIIHTTIENLFLVLFSCKSREFVQYVIENQLTYQFLTSNGGMFLIFFSLRPSFLAPFIIPFIFHLPL